eukprot:TRINITY_DN10585_c0_g1_i3.p2 TRINITY_DN10585_c0_g1~~TRINITY_DN10585_c0_g1_i3.p2  ORF type:complete len:311 (+),score=60.17 TRINITY_DN10585_c0_g1_i3:52-933(+)
MRSRPARAARTKADRFRQQGLREERRLSRASQAAIAALSSRDNCDDEAAARRREDQAWIDAARWRERSDGWLSSGCLAWRPASAEGVVPFLQALGFCPDTYERWPEAAANAGRAGGFGPALALTLDEHQERAEHTWYIIQCALVPAGATQEQSRSTTKWSAPRRLVQLRGDLHGPVKEFLDERYAEHFGATPFARIGGPRGTTSRLRGWLSSLARYINSGEAPPIFVAGVLNFFRPPAGDDDSESDDANDLQILQDALCSTGEGAECSPHAPHTPESSDPPGSDSEAESESDG